MGKRVASRMPLDVIQAIDAAWSAIPVVLCKGLCHSSCTSILMSEAETVRLEEHDPSLKGHPWKRAAFAALDGRTKPKPCPALTKAKKCGVYPVRPAICRMYGAAEGLDCPHGCEIRTPDGKPMSKTAAALVLRKLHALDPYPDPLT